MQISFKSVRIFDDPWKNMPSAIVETAKIGIRTPLKFCVYFRFVS